MQHDTLGTVTHEAESGNYLAVIDYCARQVTIRIDPDGDPHDRAIDLAAEVAKQLESMDLSAKQVAASKLRDVYNESWREYDEDQGGGNFKTVCDPELSEEEFSANLSLNAINVTGADTFDFFYHDGEMFSGHSVIVTSFNGLVFSKTDATLFG